MSFTSTRGEATAPSLSSVLAAGLAPDGGLFVPEELPRLEPARFGADLGLARDAATLLAPFFRGDALEPHLRAICAEAYAFDAPLLGGPGPADLTLELFHGPTCAFKDFGARFLAACLQRMETTAAEPLQILVATSGDTGAAVASAFHEHDGFEVVILYPRGLVSPRQAHQLGSFGGNVRAFAVEGSFDDCQRMVKDVLGDPALRNRLRLTSANSISLGRLLPQMAYFAAAALRFRAQSGARDGTPLGFVIPTGNLGNAVACVWAKAMGLPIGRIALATNANHVLPDFFAGGEFAPARSVATLASAMDVGNPSNFERLRWTHRGERDWRAHYASQAFDDAAIRAEIARRDAADGAVLCPHTATASLLRERLRADGERGPLALVATAHPAKFEAVVDPLVSVPTTAPSSLQRLLARRASAIPLEASTARFVDRLRA